MSLTRDEQINAFQRQYGVGHERAAEMIDRAAARVHPFTPRVNPPDAADARAELILEKQEQREVYKVYRANGCKVYWLSQARRTRQTPGLPDLWVVALRVKRAWWHETKRQVGGRLSPAQQEFADDCHACRVGHVVGDRYEAERQLIRVGLCVRGEDGTLHPAPQPAW